MRLGGEVDVGFGNFGDCIGDVHGDVLDSGRVATALVSTASDARVR